MSVIRVRNLHKYYTVYQKEVGLLGSLRSLIQRKYEQVHAVEDVSFEIDEGELVGFIGPNGAGKTTTLKCLSGLLYPDGGKVQVLKFTPFERKDSFLKQISLVMGQKNQLWWDLPAMDTYVLNKEIYEIPDKQFSKTLDNLATLLDMQELATVPVRKLSLGQRMKAELIAALIHSPKVLFLDEPTIGLDVVMQKVIRDFIKEYNQHFGATIILTSHYMGDVQELCQRVIVIDKGRIIYDGALTDLVRKYADHKCIKVTLAKKVSKKDVNKIGVVAQYEYPLVEYTVSPQEVNRIATRILHNLPVDDLNIEEPAIEDVIRKVFSDV